jgi:hypothetical protein
MKQQSHWASASGLGRPHARCEQQCSQGARMAGVGRVTIGVGVYGCPRTQAEEFGCASVGARSHEPNAPSWQAGSLPAIYCIMVLFGAGRLSSGPVFGSIGRDSV